MVDEREEAIAEARWRADIEAAKQKKLLERQEEFQKHMLHWNATIGAWHEKNNHLRMLKAEYMTQRKQALSRARTEFLNALSDDIGKWVESPSECRFQRFRFVEGVQFPYNKTAYI